MNIFAQEDFRQNDGAAGRPLTVVGQDMHILNPVFFRAVEERDSHALAAMALQQAVAGADAFLDVNLGPAKKNSALLAWVLETVQEAAGLPLLVASQILRQPELLRQDYGRITVNSVTADPAALAAAMETAGQHEAGLVVLLTKPGLTSFSADDRLLLAAEVLETAAHVGFPLEKLYLDPLFRPGPQGQAPVLETLAALSLLGHEKVRSIAGLSSASAFLSAAKRSAFQQSLLPLLVEAGLDAVILNCNDRKLMDIARSGWATETPSQLAEVVG